MYIHVYIYKVAVRTYDKLLANLTTVYCVQGPRATGL